LNNQLSGSYSVFSVDNADSSPDNVALTEYRLYLGMRPAIEQLAATVDIMNFDAGDAPDGEIILGHFSIDSLPLENLP
jgi:hypothetical protein